MRPIDRGKHPVDDNNAAIVFNHYVDARPHLTKRIGRYCSYCEIPKQDLVEVEHIIPVCQDKSKELDWDNFLLSCRSCNAGKTGKDIVVSDYFWSHLDNTFRAFRYLEGGLIIVNDSGVLTRPEKAKAKRTLELFNLHKDPLDYPKLSRDRWESRMNVWKVAVRSRNNLYKSNKNTEFLRKQIALTGLGHGHWSIWMTVFKSEKDMLRRFITTFPGTCRECFNDDLMPVQRNPNGL